jgi:hypothetical protein
MINSDACTENMPRNAEAWSSIGDLYALAVFADVMTGDLPAQRRSSSSVMRKRATSARAMLPPWKPVRSVRDSMAPVAGPSVRIVGLTIVQYRPLLQISSSCRFLSW